MIENLINLLTKLIKYNFNIFFHCLIFTMCMIIIYLLLKKKVHNNYKINNFFSTYAFISIYISIFIIGIILLRYYRWGVAVNLLDFYEKIIYMYYAYNFLTILNVLLLLLVFLLTFFIYSYNKSYHKTFKYVVERQRRLPMLSDFHNYVIIINKLSAWESWNYDLIINIKLPFLLFYKPYKLLFKKYPNKQTVSINILIKIFTLLPYILFILLFIIDCYFNNYTLTKIFYYLPFFFFYQIWRNISTFLQNTSRILNTIIYRLYYEPENFYYVNLLEEEYQFILTYMDNKLTCYLSHTMKNIDDDIAYGNYIIKCYTDIQQQLYILVDNQAIIKNEYTLDE